MPGVHLLDEELGVQALAHQPPLHVGEGDDDGVDRAALDLGAQLLEGQHARRSYSVRAREDTAAHHSALPTRAAAGLDNALAGGGEYTTGPTASEAAAGLVINEGGAA